jgi:hypothetical protein
VGLFIFAEYAGLLFKAVDAGHKSLSKITAMTKQIIIADVMIADAMRIVGSVIIHQ